MNRVRERFAWAAAGVLGLLVVAALAGVVRGGPLDPPGAPASTQRGQISSLPFTIFSPGSYVVTADLTGSVGSHGITISSDDVSIDLLGFTLHGPGGAGVENGIYSVSHNNITVRNGILRDWGGNGAYVVQGADTRLDDLQAYHNGFNGTSPFTGFALNLGSSSSAVISDCILTSNGRAGQGGGISSDGGADITNCSALNNPGTGFIVNHSNLIGCVASGNGIGIKASGSRVSGCHLNGNTGDGIDADTNNVIEDNHITRNCAPCAAIGIHVTVFPNRIENNDVSGYATGYQLDAGGNAVVKNSAAGNTTNYTIAANNTAGSRNNAGVAPTDPWANLVY